MAELDAQAQRLLDRFVAGVRDVIGEDLLCLVLYGSSAGSEWVAGRSDVNTAIVVARVTLEVLEALAPLVAARDRLLALPLVLDTEYLARARDTFPMELSDIHEQHRLLAGRDLFADLRIEPAAVRRECEQEARGKLLRLRAAFLDVAGRASDLEHVMVQSLKSFLILLRHLLRLRGAPTAHGYAAVLRGGEAALGPLPTMRRLLDHRTGTASLAPAALRAEFGRYLDEVERIVAALDRVGDGADA